MGQKQQMRERIIDYRDKSENNIGYSILSAIFSTIIMLTLYLMYILPKERTILNFALLFYI